MTTPTQPDPMGGSNDLQASIDRLDTAVRSLTTAINGTNNANGTTTSPASATSFAQQGVQFTGGTQGGGGGGLLSNVFNGSGGTSGTNPFSFSGGSGVQAATNVATSVINGQFLAGSQQLNDQAQINTYGYTQAGFWNVSSKSAIFTAFGGGSGSNLTQNNLATSASDARIGGQLLSQISGQANYTAPASGMYGRGNGAFGLAATSGFANPGLGMTNAASISGAFYNPSTSYNLMMMGVANTPLQLGTGRSQSMTGVEAAIGQRFGFQGFNAKTGTFNSQNLAANLNNPLFQMQMMEATGMSQSQYNVWSQQWAMMNNSALSGHTTMNQMQNEVSQYMNGTSSQQKSAQAWLGQHGVSQSLLQSMTQAQAGQTGAEAGGNAAFTKGLQQATSAINNLTAVMAKGLQAMAGTSGFAGAFGSLNSTGVIGAGAGGVANTVINAIASGNSLLNDIASLAGVNLSGYNTKSGSGNTGAANTSASQNQAMARNIITQMGFARGWNSGTEWNSLLSLWNQESGWNNKAQNPTSTAFGIAQFLDSTWAPYGAKTSDAATQIRYGLEYIHDRYGDPNKAWAHEQANNWYADGTSSAKPGVALVGERGPEMVALSGGQQIISAAQTAKMMQPKFGSGMSDGPGGLTIVFQSGAITITNPGNGTTGYHTSSDVQTSAAQLVQAVETGLKKSTLLRQIASGVTG